MKGIKKVWIVGDNLMATSFQQHFKKSKFEFFLKEQFEGTGFCSSKYSDSNTNPLSRIQIITAAALNAKDFMPHFIIMVIDNKLIEHVRYKGCSVATMYDTLVEWLCKEVWNLIEEKFKLLPKKARVATQVYWVLLSNSDYMPDCDRVVRERFRKCLESVVQMYEAMRVIKLKMWDPSDESLISFSNPSYHQLVLMCIGKQWMQLLNLMLRKNKSLTPE